MNPQRPIQALLAAAVVLAAGAASAAPAERAARPTTVELLPIQAGDRAPQRLVADPVAPRPDLPREAVTFTQKLAADRPLQAAAPFVARSREYFVEVGADELRAGAPIFTTHPGALVRLHAAAAELRAGRGAELSLDPQRLILRSGKAEYGAGSGMALLVDAEQLATAEAPFAPGTTAFRLDPQLGAGRFEIAAPDVRDDGRYVLHVFEPESDAVLALGTARSNYLHGDTLVTETGFGPAKESTVIERVQAFVSSPGGRTWPLTWRQAGALLRAELALDALAAPGPGLWEVHVQAEGRRGDQVVIRSVRTAFSASLPTARLGAQASVTSDKAGLAVTFPLEVASPGRYEVRGVLYGTDAAGQRRPVALAHAASFFEAGPGTLTLTIDAATRDAAGLAAPYELRDLRLLDQGRMGLLHVQERALVLP